MRKVIGRSLAAAALAVATVVPAAGMAQAAPQDHNVAMSGDHGRGHHGREYRHHRFDDCGYFPFGGQRGSERRGHRGRESYYEGCEVREYGLLERLLGGLLGWWWF